MKKLDRNKIQIPDLPYRQGSISFCNNDTLLVYKKVVNATGYRIETGVFRLVEIKDHSYLDHRWTAEIL